MMQEVTDVSEQTMVGGPAEYCDDDEDEDDADSFDDSHLGPPAERWAPIGDPGDVVRHGTAGSEHVYGGGGADSGGSTLSLGDGQRLRELEEEQERLNSSLLTLTTHFAQVQFRLQQICKSDSAADQQMKEKLLKELEEFAFRGCPDVMEVKNARQWHSNDPVTSSTVEHEQIMEKQRAKQTQLIGQLKDQLEDLERFAYESGEGMVPTSEVLEKQRVIIDQLKDRMDLNLENLDGMTQDDLQTHVDQALKRLINPMKVKEKLVEQLKTQITDLERFVEFLQGENGGVKPQIVCRCDTDKPNCFLHNGKLSARALAAGGGDKEHSSSLVVSYLLSHMGCQSQKFHKNQLKNTQHGNHWGDLRAGLELAVDTLMETTRRHETDMIARRRQGGGGAVQLNAYSSDDEEDVDDVFDKCHEEVVSAVRKHFCPALGRLLQHGMLRPSSKSMGGGLAGSLGCLPSRSRKAATMTASTADSGRAAGGDGAAAGARSVGGAVTSTAAGNSNREPHAWDILAQYYDMKHGREFSEAPVRKLTQSFNLENIGGRSITSKQMLLTTIENIQTSHSRLKRSPDAMFKAFVSAALNNKKLVPWIRMILRTREIVEENYAPYSYVAKTGFEDAFALLEKLNQFSFQLPVDLAVRPFQHIKDAF